MHNIEHFDYDEKVNKQKVWKELNDYVEHATWAEGGSGIEGIRWNDYVCESYKEALDWIEKHDKGWYDQLAVKYKEPVPGTTNKAKCEELQKKITDAGALCLQREKALYPRTRTSEYIGCSKCGSRLATKHLNSNFCPVCHADLRPETTLKAIAAAKAKHAKATKEYQDWMQKHCKKVVRWLVKIEYHT